MRMRLIPRLRRFRRREDGQATIEFVILFPAFVMIMLSSIEAGLMMARNVMLERGVDIAVRELRLGTPTPPTYEEFKQSICDNAIIFSDCDDLLQVALEPVDTGTWTGFPTQLACINEQTHLSETNPINPIDDTTFVGGGNNELMIVQACGLFDPFFPTTRFGMQMPRYDADPDDDFVSEKFALVVTSAFVNEPSR